MSAYYRFSYGVEYAVCLFHSIKQLNASERHTLELVMVVDIRRIEGI